MHIRADTVYLEKWHTSWRDRETVRTDTIQVENIRTETREVRYVPKFYKWCVALLVTVLMILFLRLLWYYKTRR